MALQDMKFKPTVFPLIKKTRKPWEKLEKDIKRMIYEYLENNYKDMAVI